MFGFWTAFQFEVFGTWHLSQFFDIFNYDNNDLSQSWWWKRERETSEFIDFVPKVIYEKASSQCSIYYSVPNHRSVWISIFLPTPIEDRLSLWYACQSPIIKWAIATHINQVFSCRWRQNQLLAQSLPLIMSPIQSMLWLKTSPQSGWKWERIYVPNVEKVIMLLDLLYPKHISICYQGKNCF